MPELGCGLSRAFIYDRRGEVRVGELDGVSMVTWERLLGEISSASVEISLAPDIPGCCDWLGDIRAMRNELVIYRDTGTGLPQRVWEGPVSRVIYGEASVRIEAKDVLFWTDRRVHRGYFTDPMNGVTLMNTLVAHAFTYDDPNVLAHRLALSAGAPPDVKSAINRADQTYFDALQDLFDQGVSFTTIGRRIAMWSANRTLSRTERLVSGTDLSGVTVVDDGEVLATRAVVNGGDTFGATSPEPVVINYARNPSVEVTLSGFSSGNAKFYDIARVATSAVGRGTYAGRIIPNPPNKPAESASDKVQRAYNEALNAFESSEVPMHARGLRIGVHEGEQITAQLTVLQRGNARAILGLRLRGMLDGEVDDDRAFVEGTPRRLRSGVKINLLVSGTVPADTDEIFVEVFRDTKVKWQADDGFHFDQFAIWRGRQEAWFDGSVPSNSTYRYAWTGAPGTSAASRTYYNPKINSYYGLIESLDDSDQKVRAALENEARTQKAKSYPTPLVLRVPENQPLLATAPIDISELVAGATIPISTTITCRKAQADAILQSVTVEQDNEGERVQITVEAGQTWDWDYSTGIIGEGGVDGPFPPDPPDPVDDNDDEYVGGEEVAVYDE